MATSPLFGVFIALFIRKAPRNELLASNAPRALETTNTRLPSVLGAAALIFSSAGLALADMVSFNPSPKDVMDDEIFTVNIVGNDFTELAGGTIDLGFDSALLTINSVTVNSGIFDFLPDADGPAVGNIWPNIGFDTFVNDPATGTFTISRCNLAV